MSDTNSNNQTDATDQTDQTDQTDLSIDDLLEDELQGLQQFFDLHVNRINELLAIGIDGNESFSELDEWCGSLRNLLMDYVDEKVPADFIAGVLDVARDLNQTILEKVPDGLKSSEVSGWFSLWYSMSQLLQEIAEE